MTNRQTNTNRRGNTLVEVTISTLLVGCLMIAALSAVGSVGKTTLSANQQTDGQELALQLMNEILSQYYCDPTDLTKITWGLEAGESSRATFDDIDDYDGWTENPVKDPSGTALTGYTGWSRSVAVTKLDLTYAPMASNSSDRGLRRITVTVTSPTGKTTQLQAFRSDVAGSLQPVSANATAVTWVGFKLQLGSNSPVSGGVNLLNLAEDQ